MTTHRHYLKTTWPRKSDLEAAHIFTWSIQQKQSKSLNQCKTKTVQILRTKPFKQNLTLVCNLYFFITIVF